MNKAGVVVVAVALTVIVGGCTKKADKNESIAKSEEFFKEIEAPVTVVANTNVQTPQTQPTAQNRANPQVPLSAQVGVPEKPTIEDIQQALVNANLYKGKIDGVLGPKTTQAIREFQTQNNLKVDGKVGPLTWTQLKAYYQSIAQMTEGSATNSR